jgi:unsaturated rhamnogalacturonyl hydrolase
MNGLRNIVCVAILASFAAVSAKTEFDLDSIQTICKRVIKYGLKSNVANDWIGGAYYTGVMGMLDMTKDKQYLDSAVAWGKNHNWGPANSALTTTGDDQCCFQTYCEVFMQDTSSTNKYMYQPALTNITNMFDRAPLASREWGWCDLLFMAPAGITRLAIVSKTPRFIDSMNAYWWNTSKWLYDTTDHLYYRDGGFIYPAQKTASGKKMFWARGNGWVVAGLARTLQYLPANYTDRAKFVTQLQQMCTALKAVQGADGLWRTSLFDYAQYPDPEMSGTCFFTFAMAYGINSGILDRATFEPAVRKAWSGMTKNVQASGALMRVQDVNWMPGPTTLNMSKPYAEGAFCLTGNEMIKMLATGARVPAATQANSDRMAPLSKKLSVLPGARIALPATATGFTAYGIDGRALYSFSRADGKNAASVALPVNLKNAAQTVVVRFVYRR